ncbi:MAG: hypothetical protein WBD73_03285, partial [Candidatus Acidiferrales bacterium]
MSEAAKPENERRKFRAIKGTRDILPPDSALWNWFEKTARGVMESYNFGEIRTPIFEETELFARSIGGETDVVNKEMYSFVDRSTPGLLKLGEFFATVDRPLSDEQFKDYVSQILAFIDMLGDSLAAGELSMSPANQVAVEKIMRERAVVH